MSATLDAVLFDFANVDGQPEAARLKEFVGRFPEYATELRELAVELEFAFTDTEKPSDREVERSLVARGLSNFLNRIGPDDQASGDPFKKLSPPAFSELSKQLGTNSLFLATVRNRSIEPDDFPPAFTRRLAEGLGTPEAAVLDYLASDPTFSAGARFKADGKPQAARVRMSFEDAALKSGLTVEELAALRKPT